MRKEKRVAEGKEVELQALALYHSLGRHICDDNIGEIRLPGDRAKRRELRAVKLDPVVVLRVLVLESLEQIRIVISVIFHVLVSQ